MPTAEELKNQGLALFQADRLPEAAAKFTEAASQFAAGGQAVAAAEMRNNLCVIRLAEKDWDGALASVGGTPEVFRANGDRLREAQALSNLGAAQDGAGRLEEAGELYVQAIEILTELGETENRAACWKALSALQIKQDKKLQALASMRSGLNLTPKLSPREKTLKGLIDRAFKLMHGQ